LPSDDVSVTVMSNGNVPATTVVAVDASDPLAVDFTIATPQVGDILVFSIGGIRFKHTVGTAVPATEATAIAALLIDPATVDRFTAAANTATVTVTIAPAQAVTVTTAVTAINLGNGGGQVQMAWAGNLVLGDSFIIDTLRPGWHYTPVSGGFESLTIYMFYDGLLHRLTGCLGTVVFTMEAGQFATAQFTFTGQYHDPDDTALPTNSVFESTNPTQVELAQLTIGNFRDICAQSFNIDMAVQINPRDCVSGADGYNGVMYTAREPKGGANPEMKWESEEPYWRNMAAATLLEFYGKVGTAPWNRVEFVSHSAQLSGINYADRNNLRVYDLTYEFVQDRDTGDDELRIAFT
jgi:hypothetical protein